MSRDTQTNFTADSFISRGGAAAPEPPQAEADEQPEAPKKEAAAKKTAKKAADKK